MLPTILKDYALIERVFRKSSNRWKFKFVLIWVRSTDGRAGCSMSTQSFVSNLLLVELSYSYLLEKSKNGELSYCKKKKFQVFFTQSLFTQVNFQFSVVFFFATSHAEVTRYFRLGVESFSIVYGKVFSRWDQIFIMAARIFTLDSFFSLCPILHAAGALRSEISDF